MKHSGDSKITQLNHEINKLDQVKSANGGLSLYKHLFTEVTALNSGAQKKKKDLR